MTTYMYNKFTYTLLGDTDDSGFSDEDIILALMNENLKFMINEV